VKVAYLGTTFKNQEWEIEADKYAAPSLKLKHKECFKSTEV
jgi:hypothetical protein